MVSIFTYRDERKLFALIGAVIVASLIALIQIDSARSGRTSPLSVAVDTTYTYFEFAITSLVNVTRGGVDTVTHIPSLATENALLRAENATLRARNDTLEETVARLPAAEDVRRALAAHPEGIAASVIGFDVENKLQTVTIDKGTNAGVHRDDGVITADGVVGKIVDASPLASKVLLLTAYSSTVPAVVQRGRWWGIAQGTRSRVMMRYISQDAKLRVGDRIVTGEGRSFHAGVLIGRVARIEPAPAGALDQSVLIEPAVAFGRLDNVIVVPK